MANIPKSGIENASTIQASHITNIIDALDGTGTYEIIATGSLTGSFEGSFSGDGTNITGVTAEWDGTHSGNAEITGSLIVTTDVTASAFNGSGVDITGVVSSSYAETASYVAGSNVEGNITGNAANITDYTITQDLATNSDVRFGSVLTGNITGSYISASNGFIGNLTGTASLSTAAETLQLREGSDTQTYNLLFSDVYAGDGTYGIRYGTTAGTFNPVTSELFAFILKAKSLVRSPHIYPGIATVDNTSAVDDTFGGIGAPVGGHILVDMTQGTTSADNIALTLPLATDMYSVYGAVNYKIAFSGTTFTTGTKLDLYASGSDTIYANINAVTQSKALSNVSGVRNTGDYTAIYDIVLVSSTSWRIGVSATSGSLFV